MMCAPKPASCGCARISALFANLRPAICYPALADASSLKRELVDGLDMMIVRELTGGVYFGEPKEIIDLGNGQKRGIDTQVYDTYEIERIGRVAFELARKRRNKVTSCEKHNVMKSGVLWRDVIIDLHKREFPDVELEHQLADACGMQLVRRPKQFDVIVTDNLFGDILSDVAAMLTGSLGMLPSASLGAVDAKTGHRKALYEPVHGSAPDIAGKGLANPIAMIGSFGMALALFLRPRRTRRQDRDGDRRRARQGPAHRRHQGRCGVIHLHRANGRCGAGGGEGGDVRRASLRPADRGKRLCCRRLCALPRCASPTSGAAPPITSAPFRGGMRGLFTPTAAPRRDRTHKTASAPEIRRGRRDRA